MPDRVASKEDLSTKSTDLPVCQLGNRLVFMSSFDFVLMTGGGEYRISFNEGYSWDGATIPRIVRPVLGNPLEERYRIASLVHDWRCEHAETFSERMVGDSIFLEILEKSGLSRTRRMAMWIGVRLWSLLFWRSQRVWQARNRRF